MIFFLKNSSVFYDLFSSVNLSLVFLLMYLIFLFFQFCAFCILLERSIHFFLFIFQTFFNFLQFFIRIYTTVNNTTIDRNRHVNRIRNRSTMDDSLGFEHDRSFRNRFGKLPHLQWPYRNTSMCIYGYVYVHNVAILWINNSTTTIIDFYSRGKSIITLRF